MPSTIDKILAYLAQDGYQHSIEQISAELSIPMDVCERITSFLSKYNAVKITQQLLQINPRIRSFLASSSDNRPLEIHLLTS